MARIAWYSNSCLVNSGYGTQSAQVVHRMVQHKHEVALQANHGASFGMQCPHGHPILAEGLVRYSIDAAPEQMQSWLDGKPGFSVVLFDAWPLAGVDGFKDMNLACWVPIDHAPVPPMVLRFLREGGHHAIAMSQFGEQQLVDAGYPRADITYIPHAIDRNIYKDVGMGARSSMGFEPDDFVVCSAAANRGRIPVRKGWGEMADAMARFMRDRKDVKWMIHTEPNGHSEGVNIPRLLATLGVDAQRVRYPHPQHLRAGIPNEAINAMYSASNAHLLTSMGEGFGLPTVESASAGTPQIVSDASAQSELVGAHGHKVKVQRVWDEYQGSWFAIPNVDAIYEALQAVYEETKAGKVDRAKVAAEMARYDADTVYTEKWEPLIAMMTERKRQPAQPLNRAQRRAQRGR